MKRFAQLADTLESALKTSVGADTEEKCLLALQSYLHDVPPEDAVWAISLLSGEKAGAVFSLKTLKQFAFHFLNTSNWLYEAAHRTVKDGAETLALLIDSERPLLSGGSKIPESTSWEPLTLARYMTQVASFLRQANQVECGSWLYHCWMRMSATEMLFLHKLLLGQFRLKLPDSLLNMAIGKRASTPKALLSKNLPIFTNAGPNTILAVLLYARQQGYRFAEYTFAVWDDTEKPQQLVSIGKVPAGSATLEIQGLEEWIYANTLSKFGPVRSLEPYHVFELAFDNILPSKRHKAGFILENLRVVHWRPDCQMDAVACIGNLNDCLIFQTGELTYNQETLSLRHV